METIILKLIEAENPELCRRVKTPFYPSSFILSGVLLTNAVIYLSILLILLLGFKYQIC